MVLKSNDIQANSPDEQQTPKREDTLIEPESVQEESLGRANGLHAMMNGEGLMAAAIAKRGAGMDPDQEWNLSTIKSPNPNIFGSISGKLGRGWNYVADKVRHVTPAIIVNESSRLSFASRAAADTLSLVSGMKFSSAPRTAASGISLSGLLLGLMFEEKPMSEEERAKIKDMPMLDYMGMRIKNGFDPRNHVTATVGLATIPNGILTAISGIAQSRKGNISMEVWQGLMTVGAGLSLNMIPDQERAWQVGTGIFLARIPFAYGQAKDAYNIGKPRLGGIKSYTALEKEWVAAEQVVVENNIERKGLLDYLQPKTQLVKIRPHVGGAAPSLAEIQQELLVESEAKLMEAKQKAEVKKVAIPESANWFEKRKLNKQNKELKTSVEKAQAYHDEVERGMDLKISVQEPQWLEFKDPETKEMRYAIGQEWKALPGDWQQNGKFWFNQLSNTFGFMYGGVKKDADGNIIRLQKRQSEPQPAAMQSDTQDNQPTNAVSGPVASERLQDHPSKGQSAAHA